MIHPTAEQIVKALRPRDDGRLEDIADDHLHWTPTSVLRAFVSLSEMYAVALLHVPKGDVWTEKRTLEATEAANELAKRVLRELELRGVFE